MIAIVGALPREVAGLVAGLKPDPLLKRDGVYLYWLSGAVVACAGMGTERVTLAVRHGAICYLAEIVEARQDTTVVIHPLTDARRILPLAKHNELIHAHADFQLTISYNPGYQNAVKDLKESTKQRFVAIDFAYPPPAVEAEIITREAATRPELAALLVDVGERSRNLRAHGLDEGASTRMLIHTARLIGNGIAMERAVQSGIVLPITDDLDVREALTAAISACLR